MLMLETEAKERYRLEVDGRGRTKEAVRYGNAGQDAGDADTMMIERTSERFLRGRISARISIYLTC